MGPCVIGEVEELLGSGHVFFLAGEALAPAGVGLAEGFAGRAVVHAFEGLLGSGATGISGEVTAANSLVGTSTNHSVGVGGVRALTNGNYLVLSHDWDGAFANVGALTWGNGTTGTSGAVSAANSLVGSRPDDRVGEHVTTLTNGNYVARSALWTTALW